MYGNKTARSGRGMHRNAIMLDAGSVGDANPMLPHRGVIIAIKPAIKPVMKWQAEPFYSPFTPIKPDM